jgi:hypothetical protein
MTAEKAPIHAESILQLWTCLSLEPTYIGSPFVWSSWKPATLDIKANSSTHKRGMMKSVSLLALIASTAFALGQLKDASDYLNEPEKYKGKKIVLPCAYIGRASGPSEDPQYVMFGAVTATKGANSKRGGIKVAVPASEASAFLKKYGVTPDYDQNVNYRTKPLAGIFTKDKEGYYYLVYEPPK